MIHSDRTGQDRTGQDRTGQDRTGQPVLYLVVPAYNEAENIKKFIDDWYPVVDKYNGGGKSRLVIIDDGSKDDTYQILETIQKSENKNLLIPVTKQNGGHGAAVLAGYKYALEHGADYIFQTDSDGQTLPSEFEQFWNLREQFDAVLGKRPHRQDGASRKFVENTLRFILKIIFGVNVPDANAPFRLMKRDLLAKYILKMPEDFNLPNVMLTTYFAYFHEKIKFLEITFRPRQGGVNSINFSKIVKIGWRALGDFMALKRALK